MIKKIVHYEVWIMNKNLIALVLILLLAGCTQVEETPSGRITAGEVGDIVKEALPETKPAEDGRYFARITVNEGEMVNLDLDATDPDGDPLEYSFSQPLNDEGIWQTEQGDAGQYPVNVTVSDGNTEVTQQILIIVESQNQPPRLERPRDIRAKEGETIRVGLEANDPDDDELEWDYSEPFNDEGVWETESGDRGRYQVTVSVSDGQFEDSATFFVTVEPGNQPPNLDVSDEVYVKEGEVVELHPEVEDPDGDEVEIAYRGWMNSSTYKTDYDDEGRHKVVVEATDGIHIESAVVWINVENVNRPPKIQGLIVK